MLQANTFSPWLEALRGCACLSVVLYHSGLNSGNDLYPILDAVALVANHGWLGVPVFFVLSGYFIAGAVERRAARAGGAIAFWRDRLLRIYPVFWAAFLVSGLLALVATLFNGLPSGSAWPSNAAAWAGDLSLTGMWFGLNPRLLVSWSLDYEISFYVLAGLTLFLPQKAPFARISGFAVLTLLAHLSPAQLFPPLDLWPQFAAGAAVYYASTVSLPRWIRMVCLAYPAILLGQSALVLHTEGIVASLTAFGVIMITRIEHRITTPPRWLVAAGVASYSIYLMHVPVMSPLRNLASRFASPSDGVFMVVWIAQIAAGIGAGIVFHRFVESPCERLRRQIAVVT